MTLSLYFLEEKELADWLGTNYLCKQDKWVLIEQNPSISLVTQVWIKVRTKSVLERGNDFWWAFSKDSFVNKVPIKQGLDNNPLGNIYFATLCWDRYNEKCVLKVRRDCITEKTCNLILYFWLAETFTMWKSRRAYLCMPPQTDKLILGDLESENNSGRLCMNMGNDLFNIQSQEV